jgi:hypothetical protein
LRGKEIGEERRRDWRMKRDWRERRRLEKQEGLRKRGGGKVIPILPVVDPDVVEVELLPVVDPDVVEVEVIAVQLGPSYPAAQTMQELPAKLNGHTHKPFVWLHVLLFLHIQTMRKK